MFKLVCVAALLAVASAFKAPVRAGRTPVKMMASTDSMIGAGVETQGFWDPLGLSKDEGRLERYRVVELKHARVSMLGNESARAHGQRSRAATSNRIAPDPSQPCFTTS
mmetsp:Transcript_24348/g.76334  ORF Transcript_24348/g.76334 Transcript_24348/m.76334 type:complete len:109 (-) Transcript_24348:2-328(-)